MQTTQTATGTMSVVILGAFLVCAPVAVNAQGNSVNGNGLAALQKQVDALQAKVDALGTGDDTVMQEQIDALGSMDGTLQSEIDALQAQLDGLQQSKDIVEESNWSGLFSPSQSSCGSSPKSVTINVPSSGKVFVDAMVAVHYSDPWAELHLSSLSGVCDSPTGSVVTIQAAGQYSYAQYVARRVFSVEAGTHTFYLNAVKFNTHNTQIERQNLRAVFVPD